MYETDSSNISPIVQILLGLVIDHVRFADPYLGGVDAPTEFDPSPAGLPSSRVFSLRLLIKKSPFPSWQKKVTAMPM